MAAASNARDGQGLLDQPGASQAIEEFCNEVNQRVAIDLAVDWNGDDAGQFFQDNVAHYLGQRNVVPDPDYQQNQHREGGRRTGEADFRNFGVDVKATEHDDLETAASFERVTDRAFGLQHALLVFVYSTPAEGRERDRVGTVMGGRSADADLPVIERCFYVPRERTADVLTSRAANETVRRTLQRTDPRDETERRLRDGLADVVDGGAPTAAEIRRIAEDRSIPQEGVLEIRPEFQWTVRYAPYLGRNRDPDKRPAVEARNDVTDVFPP